MGPDTVFFRLLLMQIGLVRTKQACVLAMLHLPWYAFAWLYYNHVHNDKAEVCVMCAVLVSIQYKSSSHMTQIIHMLWCPSQQPSLITRKLLLDVHLILCSCQGRGKLSNVYSSWEVCLLCFFLFGLWDKAWLQTPVFLGYFWCRLCSMWFGKVTFASIRFSHDYTTIMCNMTKQMAQCVHCCCINVHTAQEQQSRDTNNTQ